MDIVFAEKYYDQIKERFPELTEKQIDKMVKYGLRVMFSYTRSGADVIIRTNYFQAYFGKYFKNRLIFWKYIKLKRAIKARINYIRAKRRFKGKYYFAADQDFHNLVYPKKYKRLKMHFHFDGLWIFKCPDEAALENKKYIFEVNYPEDLGFKHYLRDVTLPRPVCVAKQAGYRNYEPVSIDDKRYAKYNNKQLQRRSKLRPSPYEYSKYGAYRQR